MAPRTVSTAERFIVDEVASPEETQHIFGMSDRRAATLAKWASEALREVEATPRPAPVGPAKVAKRVPKKKAAKR